MVATSPIREARNRPAGPALVELPSRPPDAVERSSVVVQRGASKPVHPTRRPLRRGDDGSTSEDFALMRCGFQHRDVVGLLQLPRAGLGRPLLSRLSSAVTDISASAWSSMAPFWIASCGRRSCRGHPPQAKPAWPAPLTGRNEAITDQTRHHGGGRPPPSGLRVVLRLAISGHREAAGGAGLLQPSLSMFPVAPSSRRRRRGGVLGGSCP